jgi:hypothetical protein
LILINQVICSQQEIPAGVNNAKILSGSEQLASVGALLRFAILTLGVAVTV